MFWRHFADFTDRIALVDRGGRALTYRELAERCSAFASRIAATDGGLVLIETDNSIESIVAFYGTLLGNKAAALVEHGNADLVASFTATYRPALHYASRSGEYRLVETGLSSTAHPDLALILSTSGSTGSSKAVRLSARNLQANAESICGYLEISDSDRTALLLPIHYCYGLSVLNSHLCAGASCCVGERSVTDDDFFDFLLESGIHSFAGVPLTFELLEKRRFRQHDFPDLRYVTQAGGRLAPELVANYAEWAEQSKKRFFVMYGQTEATARIAYVPPGKLRANPESIGIAIPGGELQLVDESGSEIVGPDTTGELVYRGENIMMGYAESAADLARGHELTHLKTGDLAARDNKGMYRIVGRLKRIAKIYGKRFNLDEIEAFLSNGQTPVYCTSDDRTLFVSCAGTADSAIAQQVEDKFGIDRHDIQVDGIESIPMLASGKPDYARLARLAQAKHAGRATEHFSGQPIRTVFGEAFPRQSFPDSASFVSLGGDSLTYIQVSLGIEQSLGFLPDGWEKKTVSELETLRDGAGQARLTGKLESGIALRAIATIFVVVGHVTDGLIEGGANLLLIISGLNYFRFQWPNLLAGEFTKIVRSVLTNILIPYWLIVIGYGVLRNGEIPFADVFLLHNDLEPIVPNVPFGVWYVQALMQCIVIFSLPLMFASVRSWITENSKTFAIIAVALCVLVRVADELFNWGGFGSIFETNWVLWMFALGLFLGTFSAQRDRILASAVCVALAGIFFYEDVDRLSFVAIGCLVLIWFRLVLTGKLIGRVFSLIGSASLFIYMLHIRVFPLTDNAVLRVILGIAAGLLAWRMYEYARLRLFGMHGVLAKALVSRQRS
jgi:acyl-CoA synthetase (AMP-forming)/AMP-acid ligase II